MRTSAEACGKFIVTGEHAVMYGAPCLAYPLKNCSLKVALEETSSSSPAFEIYWNGKKLGPSQEASVDACLKEMGFRDYVPRHFVLKVESQIPVGSGLGSSAAFCVALARLLPIEGKDLFDRALRGEKAFHGNPSGVDPATVLSEQPLVYRRQPLNQSPLHLKESGDLYWVLRDSGERHATSRVLKELRSLGDELHQKCVEELSQYSQNFIDLVKNFDGSLEEKQEMKRLVEQVRATHERMKITSPAMRISMDSLLAEGALASKLTGAGCGGYVLGLFEASALKRSFKARSNDYVVTFSGNDVTADWVLINGF